MPKCRLCEHLNPAGAERCQKCGTWLVDEATPARRESSIPERAEPADALEGQVLDLMRGGQKIQAIKLYREQTATGLKEAKEAVEALAMQHNISPRGAGCAGAALMLLLVAGAVLWACG